MITSADDVFIQHVIIYLKYIKHAQIIKNERCTIYLVDFTVYDKCLWEYSMFCDQRGCVEMLH